MKPFDNSFVPPSFENLLIAVTHDTLIDENRKSCWKWLLLMSSSRGHKDYQTETLGPDDFRNSDPVNVVNIRCSRLRWLCTIDLAGAALIISKGGQVAVKPSLPANGKCGNLWSVSYLLRGYWSRVRLAILHCPLALPTLFPGSRLLVLAHSSKLMLHTRHWMLLWTYVKLYHRA